MKVFLDTNVLVSAVATRGLCADVLRVVLKEHEFIFSEKLIMELSKVLTEKIKVPPDIIRSYIELIQQDSIITKTSKLLDLNIRDTDDLPIISSAFYAGAEVFITGDQELLDLHQLGKMAILSPRMFWDLLTKEK